MLCDYKKDRARLGASRDVAADAGWRRCEFEPYLQLPLQHPDHCAKIDWFFALDDTDNLKDADSGTVIELNKVAAAGCYGQFVGEADLLHPVDFG